MGIRIYYAKRQKTEPVVVKNSDIEDQSIHSQPDPFVVLLKKFSKKDTGDQNFLPKIAVYGGDKYALCAPTEDTSSASVVYHIEVDTILKLFKEGIIRTVPGYKHDTSWLTISATIAFVRCGFMSVMSKYVTSQPQIALSVMALAAPTYYSLEMLRYRTSHGKFPQGIAHQQLVTDVGRVSMKIFANLIGWKVGDDLAKDFSIPNIGTVFITGAGAAIGTMMVEHATNRSDKTMEANELQRMATALGIKFDAEKFDMDKLLCLTREQLEDLVQNPNGNSLDNTEVSKGLLNSLQAAFNKNLITLGLRAFAAGSVWTVLEQSIPEDFLSQHLAGIDIAKPLIDSVATAATFWATGASVDFIADAKNSCASETAPIFNV